MCYIMNKIPFGDMDVEITAEKIYYTIIGSEKELNELLNKNNINNINNNKNRKYIVYKLTIPLATIREIESDKNDINITIGDNMEQMQCIILCDCSFKEEKEYYSLLYIEQNNLDYLDKKTFTLKYPEINIKGNLELNKYIIDDIKSNIGEYPKYIEDNIKLIDITGNYSDTLIYSIRINNNK